MKQAFTGVERGIIASNYDSKTSLKKNRNFVLDENPKNQNWKLLCNEKVTADRTEDYSKGASGITEELVKTLVKTATGEILKIFNETLECDLETNFLKYRQSKDLVFKLEAQFPEMNTLMDRR